MIRRMANYVRISRNRLTSLNGGRAAEVTASEIGEGASSGHSGIATPIVGPNDALSNSEFFRGRRTLGPQGPMRVATRRGYRG